jgi:hypothetical protein
MSSMEEERRTRAIKDQVNQLYLERPQALMSSADHSHPVTALSLLGVLESASLEGPGTVLVDCEYVRTTCCVVEDGVREN